MIQIIDFIKINLTFFIERLSCLLGFILEKFPFFNESSGLKNIELITLIPSFAKILIIALIIAASPNFSCSNYTWHIINTF